MTVSTGAWLILPTFNEAENLEAIVRASAGVLDGAAVLETIDLPSVRSRGYAFQVELTNRSVRAGFRVTEVPIVFRDRVRGTSKMSGRIALEAVLLVPKLRWAWRPPAAAAPEAAPQADSQI